jgi:hypothetical protein
LLRQYFTHLISSFFLLSVVVNNQTIPQAKSNFTKEKKTKKLATKLTEPALSNLTSSSNTTTTTNKQTNKRAKKKKKNLVSSENLITRIQHQCHHVHQFHPNLAIQDHGSLGQ